MMISWFHFQSIVEIQRQLLNKRRAFREDADESRMEDAGQPTPLVALFFFVTGIMFNSSYSFEERPRAAHKVATRTGTCVLGVFGATVLCSVKGWSRRGSSPMNGFHHVTGYLFFAWKESHTRGGRLETGRAFQSAGPALIFLFCFKLTLGIEFGNAATSRRNRHSVLSELELGRFGLVPKVWWRGGLVIGRWRFYFFSI